MNEDRTPCRGHFAADSAASGRRTRLPQPRPVSGALRQAWPRIRQYFPEEYLRRAQALRDTPAGGPVLEADKPGGVITKFDRRSGAFGAYNADRTIRTFFIPNDGEGYFRRQARRPND